MMLMLLLLLAIAAAMPAEAAQKGLIVTYKGKSVTLFNKKGISTSYVTLSKKWGAAKTVTANENGYIKYIYKKGKSSVEALYHSGEEYGEEGYTSYAITIKDTNMKLNGVTVGMKKSKALSKLKSAFGSGSCSYSQTGKRVEDIKKDRTIYVYFANFMPIECKYNKAGKITKITFWCS